MNGPKVLDMNRPPKKVALTYCSGDMVHADFASMLNMLVVYSRNNGVYTVLINPKASTIDLGRSNGVSLARQNGFDYLFFVDSDMMVPPDTIVRLLAHEKPVVGASYCQRRMPFRLTHTELDGSPGRLDPGDKGIREVQRLPTGCMLIDMTVWDKFDELYPEMPYFHMKYPGGRRILSEDNAFCDNMRECGYSVWLDCDLTRETVHLGQYPYRLEDSAIAEMAANEG